MFVYELCLLILGLMFSIAKPFANPRVLSRSTMESLLQRVWENNDVSRSTLGDPELDGLVPFVVDGKGFGYARSSFAQECCKHPEAFRLVDGTLQGYNSITLQLNQRLQDSGDVYVRTEGVAKVTRALKDQGLIKGWRDELLPVVNNFGSEPALLIERAAYPFFGIKGFGVHLNGYVRPGVISRTPGGEMKLWVATRSPTKSTWPGMLDHMVAGGQPHGISPTENVIKECGEEAGVPAELAARAIPTSVVSYLGFDEAGELKRDSLFCFDLELPEDFTPKPVDGEVSDFQLRDLDWVIDQVKAWRYKPNCNLVVIDFLFRHGVIAPESPLYIELHNSLRGGSM